MTADFPEEDKIILRETAHSVRSLLAQPEEGAWHIEFLFASKPIHNRRNFASRWWITHQERLVTRGCRG